jgi:hypothetical protein
MMPLRTDWYASFFSALPMALSEAFVLQIDNLLSYLVMLRQQSL